MNRSSTTQNFILGRMILLLEEQGWAQHVMVQDRDGAPCYVDDPGAWYFSLIGALFWVLFKYPQTEKFKEGAIRSILRTLNKRNASAGLNKELADIIKDREASTDEWKKHFNRFNDAPGRTKMEVVRLLKEAMEG